MACTFIAGSSIKPESGSTTSLKIITDALGKTAKLQLTLNLTGPFKELDDNDADDPKKYQEGEIAIKEANYAKLLKEISSAYFTAENENTKIFLNLKIEVEAFKGKSGAEPFKAKTKVK